MVFNQEAATTAAPSFEDGHVCTACEAPLPLHSAKCPYRHSLNDSFDAMAGVAAPLLAGFSIAFIGLVISSAAAFRWPGWTLLSLTVSALLLITAVQGGFWARHYRPDVSDEDRQAQNWNLALPEFKRWVHVTRWSYNSGIALLLLGIALALFPGSHARDAVWRQAAAWIAVAAAIGEVIWALLAHRSALGMSRPSGLAQPIRRSAWPRLRRRTRSWRSGRSRR